MRRGTRIKQPSRKYLKSRKYGGFCEGCREPKESSEVFQKIDDTCAAQSYHAPYLCRECYLEKYEEGA